MPNPKKPKFDSLLGANSGLAYVEERRALLKAWSVSPKAFLHGRDVDGTPIIITQDEQDDLNAFKPFPSDLTFLDMMIDELMRPVAIPTEAEVTLIDKSRRMMVSTTIMLLGYWTVLFRKGRKVLLSKQTRELAEMMLMDKVRSTHLRTPEWFQKAMPLSMEPKDIARAAGTGSEIICVSQNAAARHFRGNAASILIIDEAAVQEFLGDMMQAANSMTQRIWVPTTANHGNPGADEFNRLRQEQTAPDCVPIEAPGYSARTTTRGYRVITLDAWANPHRDEAWLERARARSGSEADFQREVMRNWNITSGTTFYPEFSEIGRDRYLYEPRKLLAGPVIRGWDFGVRAPFVTWMQYAPKTDRVYVLREWGPRDIAAHHFRDVARYMSGQVALEELEAECLEWVDLWNSFDGVPKLPWFAPGTEFIDLSGPEVNMRQSIASKTPNEATLRQVWAAAGIEFSVQSGPVRARTAVLRRLLPLREDGWPGIVISPHCPDTLAMLDGGLTFRKQTPANPKPEEPRKDGKHENTHDALTYALVGIVAAEGVPGITAPKLPQVEESIGWSL